MAQAQPPAKKLTLKRMGPVLGVLVIAALGTYFLRETLSFEMLSDNREALLAWRDENYVLTALCFVLLYALIVTFSLPGAAAMSLTGGFLFAVFPGTFFNVAGATIGAIAIFSAVKLGLGDYLHQRFFQDNGDGRVSVLERMGQELKENEISYLFLLRLVPVIPFFIANLAPAFLGVRFRNYALTTFIGIFPAAFVYTSIGAGLGEVFAAGEAPNLGLIFEWHILGPILGLCALAALPIMISKLRPKKEIL